MQNPAHLLRIPTRAALALLTLVGVVCSVLIGSSAVATPARALPPVCDENGCPTDPDPDPVLYTYSATLSITPPSVGSVVGTAPQSANSFDCRPGGAGVCTVTDTVETTSPRRPASGWPAYTLHPSNGAAGYAFRWNTGCQSDGDCVITNNVETGREAAGRWVDVTAPDVVTIDAPTSVRDDTPIRVVARDNDRVSQYQWRACPLLKECTREQTGPEDVFTIGQQLPGKYTVAVRAADPSGNWTRFAETTVRYDTAAPSVAITAPDADAPVSPRFETSFSVSDDDTALKITCALDNGTFSACSSPFVTTVGTYGRHVVRVAATDSAGNRTQVERAVRVVATELHPETDFPPTYGKRWYVAWGSLAPDATGTVQVRDRDSGALLCSGPTGSKNEAGCRVSGTALRPGDHIIDVTYGGDAHNPSARGSFTTTVQAPAPPEQRFAIRTPATKYGVSHTLVAVSLPDPATGTVTFTAHGKTLCRAVIRTGTARCAAGGASLSVGAHVIRAVFADPVWPGQVATSRLVVARGTTRVTATAGPARLHRRVTLTVKVQPGTASGRVTFTSGKRTLCTAAVGKGTARCTTAKTGSLGRVAVSVRYSGDARWSSATVATSYRVAR